MDALVIGIGKPKKGMAGMPPGAIRVPVDSLSQTDGSGEAIAPEAGDMVDLSVSGRVHQVDGNQAIVIPEVINGRDLESPREESQEPESEESSLRKQAEESDEAEMKGY